MLAAFDREVPYYGVLLVLTVEVGDANATAAHALF